MLQRSIKKVLSAVLRAFLKGLLIVGPFAVTVYLIFWIFGMVDGMLYPLLPQGLGFFVILLSITLIGFLVTRSFFGQTLFNFLDKLLKHTPGVKYVYSSIKDVMTSFVGDNKRFNVPVWVCTQRDPEIWRIGFLTQPDMTYLALPDKVAVYLPHSYAISGWVIVTDVANIKRIHNMSAAEAMKFAVSGGVTTQEEPRNDGNHSNI